MELRGSYVAGRPTHTSRFARGVAAILVAVAQAKGRASRDDTTFSAVRTDTALRLTSRRNGLKEELVLASPAALVRFVTYSGTGAVSRGGNYVVYSGDNVYEGCNYLESADQWHCTSKAGLFRAYVENGSATPFGPAALWATNQVKVARCVQGFVDAFKTSDTSYIVNNCA